MAEIGPVLPLISKVIKISSKLYSNSDKFESSGTSGKVFGFSRNSKNPLLLKNATRKIVKNY